MGVAADCGVGTTNSSSHKGGEWHVNGGYRVQTRTKRAPATAGPGWIAVRGGRKSFGEKEEGIEIVGLCDREE